MAKQTRKQRAASIRNLKEGPSGPQAQADPPPSPLMADPYPVKPPYPPSAPATDYRPMIGSPGLLLVLLIVVAIGLMSTRSGS